MFESITANLRSGFSQTQGEISARKPVGVLTVIAFVLMFLSVVSAQPVFKQVVVDGNAIAYERDMADINGDGKTDIVMTPHPGDGTDCDNGLIAYLAPEWDKVILFRLDPAKHGYGYFRIDDFKLADMDGDGDPDAVTRIAPNNDGEGVVCWFENPFVGQATIQAEWPLHVAGKSARYTKDLVVEDMDGDGRLDIVTREDSEARIYFQNGEGDFQRKSMAIKPHEGMEVGDIDEDGRPDLVLNGFWLRAPENPRTEEYTFHEINSKWYTQSGSWEANSCKISIGDINADGHPDIVLSQSEWTGYPVAWYEAEAPGDPNTTWREHAIQDDFRDCHTLHVADFDGDGHLDVLAGGMPQSNFKGLRLFLGKGGADWETFIIQESGSYSSEVADIDDDGDLDVVGIRNWNQGPTEIWRNVTPSSVSMDRWTHKQLDDSRGASHGHGYFGLGFGNYHRTDGYADIVSGRYFYRNPGGDMLTDWKRTTLPIACDGMVIVDVDGDAFVDVIAQELPEVYWLEATDEQASGFEQRRVIGRLNVTDHRNGQGYGLADLNGDGSLEVLMAHGPASDRHISCFVIPANPMQHEWKRIDLATGANDEGVGVGDIDGDGDNDIACSAMKGERWWAWWENPGDLSGDWTRHNITRGETKGWLDRCHVADLNGDGRGDVVATEENGTGDRDADVWWFEAPRDPKSGEWKKHHLTTLRSANSCDVGDIDGDGDIDLSTGDLRGEKKLEVWQNDGVGNFVAHLVDTGKEHHEGARLFDLDGDGDLDIVSIAYFDYRFLHLWRND